jgi:hypothetical protein
MAALECGSRACDGDVRPELLRLNEGSAGEFQPGNPRGKTEIVFDAGTRAGLPARRGTFDNQHIQSFGSGVHRGSQSSGPRANHN